MDEIRLAIAQLVLALHVEGLRRPLAIVMGSDEDHATFLALSGGQAMVEGVAIAGPSAQAPTQQLTRQMI